MIVREAVPADAATIRIIAESAWRATYTGLLSGRTIDTFVDLAYSIERLQRRIDRHTFLVVEEDGSLVAFADATSEDGRVNLGAIYADPTRRGEGAGTLLLTELRSRFPGLPITADVLRGNRKGEVFYERRGFVPREEIETDLFGEPVVERRWWLAARLDG
jgi:GNAT superfamily N-acetyltransferase